MDSMRCSMLSSKSTFMLFIYQICIEVGWLKSTHQGLGFRLGFRARVQRLPPHLHSCWMYTCGTQIQDLHTNRPQHCFKRLFQNFLATEISKQLAEGADPQSVRLDFSMSKMKPLTLGWLLDSWQHVKSLMEGCKLSKMLKFENETPTVQTRTQHLIKNQNVLHPYLENLPKFKFTTSKQQKNPRQKIDKKETPKNTPNYYPFLIKGTRKWGRSKL